jgi:acyl-CoA-binding protein
LSCRINFMDKERRRQGVGSLRGCYKRERSAGLKGKDVDSTNFD